MSDPFSDTRFATGGAVPCCQTNADMTPEPVARVAVPLEVPRTTRNEVSRT
jgi:hypothetical protein